MSPLTLDPPPLCLSFSSALSILPRPKTRVHEESQLTEVKSQLDLAKLKDRFSFTSD